MKKLLRIVLFIFTLHISAMSLAQFIKTPKKNPVNKEKVSSQAYQDNYKTDICACITTKNPDARSLENIYNKCFAKHMITYAPFIDAEIKEDNQTQKYIKGQNVRLELQQKFKYELMYSCDIYFNIIYETRELSLKKMRETAIHPDQLDKLNELVAMHPHYQSYFKRAELHFKLGNLKKAAQDLLQSMDLNPSKENSLYTRKEKLLLAWIYEEQTKYHDAIAIYDEVSLGILDTSTEILKAIVVKKSDGQVSTTQKSDEISPEE